MGLESQASRPVAALEYQAAAGGGVYNLDDAPLKGEVWFRRDWLDERELDSTQCVVISVSGESMEPILPNGCSILVARQHQKRRAGCIYVVNTPTGMVVKWLDKQGDAWMLISDNPAPEWSPQAWSPEAEVEGEVVWMAQNL